MSSTANKRKRNSEADQQQQCGRQQRQTELGNRSDNHTTQTVRANVAEDGPRKRSKTGATQSASTPNANANAAAAALPLPSADSDEDPITEQEYMQRQYQVTRPSQRQVASSSCVNVGLLHWRRVRRAWKSGQDASTASMGASESMNKSKSEDGRNGRQKQRAMAQQSSSTPTSGKTSLPHPMSSYATSRPRQVKQREDSSADEDEPNQSNPTNTNAASPDHADDDDDDDDAFVATLSDSDSDSDINLDVPRIVHARESGEEFNPRVKLSHMVDILNVIWEDEEE